MTKTPSFAAISKHKGKRERTRAALIDATVELIASNDPANISISDITALAGVANGTFYNHFQTKAEVIAETAFRITEQIGGQIHRAGMSEGDPILRIAAGARRFVEFAVSHPSWAWALLKSTPYQPGVQAQFQQYLAATVHAGVETGDFRVEEDEFTFDVLISMLLSAIRCVLGGMPADTAGSRIAQMHLQLLGVAAEAAAVAAYGELKPFDPTLGEHRSPRRAANRRISAAPASGTG